MVDNLVKYEKKIKKIHLEVCYYNRFCWMSTQWRIHVGAKSHLLIIKTATGDSFWTSGPGLYIFQHDT